MKRLIYLTAIVGFIMVSCTKPNDNPNPNEEKTYSFSIGAEKESGGTDETRVEMVDGLMHWSVGDQIGMYVTTQLPYYNNPTSLYVNNFAMNGVHNEPARTTTFKGLLNQFQISKLDPTKTYRHFSYYPYGSMSISEFSSYNGMMMYHTIPNSITVRPNEFPVDNVYMFAEEEGLNPPMTWLENGEQKWGEKRTFTYKHTMAYIRLKINRNLSGHPIDVISVSNSTSSGTTPIPLSGRLTMYSNYKYNSDYYIAYSLGTTSYNDINVNIDGGMSVGDYIYIPIPPNRLAPYGYSGANRRSLQFEFMYRASYGRVIFSTFILPVSTTSYIFLDAGKIYDIAFNL